MSIISKRAAVAVAVVVALVLATVGVAQAVKPRLGSVAATACSYPSSGSISQRQQTNYEACRFDQLEGLIASPASTVTVTAPPVTATATATVTETVTVEPTATPTPTPTPTPTEPPAPGGACDPANAIYDWTDTSPTQSWSNAGLGAYYADQGMWNVDNYDVTQHMVVCDYNSWYVVGTADDSVGDGAVKSYPNTHYNDLIQWGVPGHPLTPMSDFTTMTSTFAATRPSPMPAGINYDTAFDIWFNDVGNSSTDNEVMIWTDHVKQQPLGTKRATVTLWGTTWDVYAWSIDATGAQVISFLPSNGQPVLLGSIDIMELYNYLRSTVVNGFSLLPPNSTIGQVDFGVELVSTGGVPVRWDFTDFSFNAS